MTQPDAPFALPESRWFRLHGGPANGAIWKIPENLTVFLVVRHRSRPALFRFGSGDVEAQPDSVQVDEYVPTLGGYGPYVWKPLMDRP